MDYQRPTNLKVFDRVRSADWGYDYLSFVTFLSLEAMNRICEHRLR